MKAPPKNCAKYSQKGEPSDSDARGRGSRCMRYFARELRLTTLRHISKRVFTDVAGYVNGNTITFNLNYKSRCWISHFASPAQRTARLEIPAPWVSPPTMNRFSSAKRVQERESPRGEERDVESTMRDPPRFAILASRNVRDTTAPRQLGVTDA